MFVLKHVKHQCEKRALYLTLALDSKIAHTKLACCWRW